MQEHRPSPVEEFPTGLTGVSLTKGDKRVLGMMHLQESIEIAQRSIVVSEVSYFVSPMVFL